MSNPITPVTVLIADEHAMFRDAVRCLLQDEPEFRVVGDTGSGDEVLRLVEKIKPHVLLLNLRMPKRSGVDILRELSSRPSQVTTLIIADSIESADMIQALKVGACGVVRKDCAAHLLFKAIRKVLEGECWIDREGVSALLSNFRSVSALASTATPYPGNGLSAREIEIVTKIGDGYTNKDIAQECSISEQTVKHHLSSIFKKLGVSNRLELALLEINRG